MSKALRTCSRLARGMVPTTSFVGVHYINASGWLSTFSPPIRIVSLIVSLDDTSMCLTPTLRPNRCGFRARSNTSKFRIWRLAAILMTGRLITTGICWSQVPPCERKGSGVG